MHGCMCAFHRSRIGVNAWAAVFFSFVFALDCIILLFLFVFINILIILVESRKIYIRDSETTHNSHRLVWCLECICASGNGWSPPLHRLMHHTLQRQCGATELIASIRSPYFFIEMNVCWVERIKKKKLKHKLLLRYSVVVVVLFQSTRRME